MSFVLPLVLSFVVAAPPTVRHDKAPDAKTQADGAVTDDADDEGAAPVITLIEDCADTFDQTEGCHPPQKTLFIPEGEPISSPTYNEYPVEIDQDTLAMQFVAVSVIPAALALSLHLLSGFYTLHTLRLNEAGTLRPGERDRIAQFQTGLLYGAIGAWFATSLVSGTGVALWIFNPKDGDVRPILKAD